jgi:hypothetical protein
MTNSQKKKFEAAIFSGNEYFFIETIYTLLGISNAKPKKKADVIFELSGLQLIQDITYFKNALHLGKTTNAEKVLLLASILKRKFPDTEFPETTRGKICNLVFNGDLSGLLTFLLKPKKRGEIRLTDNTVFGNNEYKGMPLKTIVQVTKACQKATGATFSFQAFYNMFWQKNPPNARPLFKVLQLVGLLKT